MEQTVWDERAEYSSRVSEVIESVAVNHFHVEIDETTSNRWVELMKLMREVDTEADKPNSTSAILIMLDDFSMFEDRYPSLTVSSMGSEAHQRLMSRAKTILNDGERLKKSASEYRYLAARRHEAIHTARLFADIASDQVLAQLQFTEVFMPFLERLTIAANFFDTARDARRDYDEGIINFKPTFVFTTDLYRRTLEGVLRDYPAFMHGKIVIPYAKLCILGYYSHHLKNHKKRQNRKNVHNTL